MSKILVTGGAGYIGSVLLPMLLEQGHEVTVLDNFFYEQASLVDLCIHPGFKIVRGDVRNRALVQELLQDQEFIIPLAAMVGFPLCKQDEVAAQTINQDAIEMLLELRGAGQKVIYPCTNSGYGAGHGDMFCTEETPMNPISLYGITKSNAEKAVLSAGNSLSFRFATVFGASPRMRTDLLVNDFVYRAIYDQTAVIFQGHFKRNYIHVRDAAGAFCHAIAHFDQMKGKPYNCGLSSANLSKIELCEKIKEHLPNFVYLEAPIGEDPDQRNYIVSNERLEATGWQPKYTLDDGIEELIKVYRILKKRQYSNI